MGLTEGIPSAVVGYRKYILRILEGLAACVGTGIPTRPAELRGSDWRQARIIPASCARPDEDVWVYVAMFGSQRRGFGI